MLYAVPPDQSHVIVASNVGFIALSHLYEGQVVPVATGADAGACVVVTVVRAAVSSGVIVAQSEAYSAAVKSAEK